MYFFFTLIQKLIRFCDYNLNLMQYELKPNISKTKFTKQLLLPNTYVWTGSPIKKWNLWAIVDYRKFLALWKNSTLITAQDKQMWK